MTNEVSTGQLAGRLGIPKITLIKWVNRDLLHPRVAQMGGLRMWFWSPAEVRRAEELAGRMRSRRQRKEETT
jgi:hypothetical protein